MKHPNSDLAPDPEDAAAQAFARSDAHAFRGQKLLPYSFKRQAARGRLGLTMTTALDSAFLIFLCLTPDDEVTALWGAQAINAWRGKAEAWADQQRIRETDAEEVNSAAIEILRDIHASEFDVRAEGGKGEPGPKGPGRPAKPNTSRPSRRSRTAR